MSYVFIHLVMSTPLFHLTRVLIWPLQNKYIDFYFSGSIQLTAFNESAEELDNRLEMSKTYLVSGQHSFVLLNCLLPGHGLRLGVYSGQVWSKQRN